MSGRIPEEKIEEVRAANDIVDVVGERVQLKKQGRNHFGLCPFHNENTPSFSVNEEKQIFNCFGCGKGGNVFTFIMEIEQINFVESVRLLGEKANITLPDQVAVRQNISTEAATLLEAVDWLNKYYHHLLQYSEEAEAALEYFKGRGITQETIDRFSLGYAPEKSELTTEFLIQKGFHEQFLVKNSVFNKSGSHLNDPFRDRIIFPIKNQTGNVIAFGGRSIKEEHKPKYLNSPENQLFQKRNILYNFDLAKGPIRKQADALIFEGYMDVLTADQAGFKHAVATLGTALSVDQARLLKRYTNQVTLCYDSDKAGIEATYQAMHILKDTGFDVKIAQVPEGKDPDDYIREHGKEVFKSEVLDNTRTYMQFIMWYEERNYDLDNDTQRFEYVTKIVQQIAKVTSAIERDFYINELSSKLNLSETTLKNEVNQLVKPTAPQTYETPQPQFQQFTRRKKTIRPAFENAERYLLAHLIQGHFVEKIQNELGVNFNLEKHKVLATHIYGLLDEKDEISESKLMDNINDHALIQEINDILSIQLNTETTENEINDYIEAVKYQSNEVPELDKLEQSIIEAERSGEFERALELAQQLILAKK